MTERTVFMTDLNGDEHAPATLDGFAKLLDQLHNPREAEPQGYEEYLSVDLADSGEWYLEFDGETACFDCLATGGVDALEVLYASIDEAVAMARQFLLGDFEALRDRPWTRAV